MPRSGDYSLFSNLVRKEVHSKKTKHFPFQLTRMCAHLKDKRSNEIVAYVYRGRKKYNVY